MCFLTGPCPSQRVWWVKTQRPSSWVRWVSWPHQVPCWPMFSRERSEVSAAGEVSHEPLLSGTSYLKTNVCLHFIRFFFLFVFFNVLYHIYVLNGIFQSPKENCTVFWFVCFWNFISVTYEFLACFFFLSVFVKSMMEGKKIPSLSYALFMCCSVSERCFL